jgi:transcriptional regulator of heat shock response
MRISFKSLEDQLGKVDYYESFLNQFKNKKKLPKKVIDNLEQSFDSIIRFNKEREEKERLFKAKIQELKGLFEKEDIDSLRTLKFDLDEYEKLVGYEYKQEERGTVDVVQDGDSEGRDESKQG